MSKPIEINVTWSKALAIKASKLYYDYDMRHSRKRYVGWLFIALTQFGIVGALKHDSYGLLFISTFLVIYWYYIRWFLRKGMIKKYYSRSKIDNSTTTFILNDDGLHYDDHRIGWDNIHAVIEFDDGILLQCDTDSLFFDHHSFSSYDERRRFLSIMRKKEKL
jgi:hypothetical protein